MQTANEPTNEPGHVISDYYEGMQEVYRDQWDTDRRRTRNKLFYIALLILASDIMSLIIRDRVNSQNLIVASLIPAIYAGFAFMALKHPMISVSVSTGLFLLLQACLVYMVGPYILLTGWFMKAVMVFLILSAFSVARDAEKARRLLASEMHGDATIH